MTIGYSGSVQEEKNAKSVVVGHFTMARQPYEHRQPGLLVPYTE